jgi:DNA (cytosine-5)-methyltransferase 1
MGWFRAVDLFCGAGGTSTGLYNACMAMGKKVDLLAINHWQKAIDTHQANHPEARCLCAPLESIDPRVAVPSGHLDILVASPECTYHSNARGGKPINDQLRASAWHVLRWLELLKVDNVLIENVPCFQQWGPLGTNDRPLKNKKGETFQAFLSSLRSFGYTVEHRVLNAADYGDPTSRHRLFIIARRGNNKIDWPEVTHAGKTYSAMLLGDELKPYRNARDVIDWDLHGKSIFQRKKPLAKATLDRIAAGLRKYGGKNAEPFLVMLYGTGDVRSVDRPMPTITAGGGHIGLCEPFLVQYHGDHAGQNDGERRTHDVDQPLPTLDTSNRYGLCEPFIAIMKGQSKTRDVDSPLPTITTNPHLYLCEPFLTKYYGCGKGAASINEPLDTITTKDRFGLVEPCTDGETVYDIRFRMLQPHELSAAMSFGKDYQFKGNKGDQIKQIGNAVPVRMAQALCAALLVKAKAEIKAKAA